MSEGLKKEDGQRHDFEQRIITAIASGDAVIVRDLLIELDEVLEKGMILESIYKRPGISRTNLDTELQQFLREAQHDSASYVFGLTGGNDRIRILVEHGKIVIEPTQNCSDAVRGNWEKSK